MRKIQFVIFLSVVLSIYSLGCIFVYLKYDLVASYFNIPRLVYFFVFLFLAASFVIGRFLERKFPNKLVFFLVKTGSFFMGSLLYFFLFLLAETLIIAMVRILHLMEGDSIYILKVTLRLIIFAVTLGLLGYGYANALHTRIRRMTIHTSKLPPAHPGFSLVAVTDVHLGSIRGLRSVSRLVRMINKEPADLVLFGGDTLDEDLAPVIAQNIGDCLLKIKSTLGVYGISGNHEFIGGITDALGYLNTHGIKMLADECLEVAEHLLLAGRIDRDTKRFTGKEREPLEHILPHSHKENFVVLLDHQPFRLEEAADLQVDLQISGHTHDGQLWPLNLLTRKIYEKSAGYLKKGDTHFIISTGYGTWGPPFRIGTSPEIWRIVIQPEASNNNV